LDEIENWCVEKEDRGKENDNDLGKGYKIGHSYFLKMVKEKNGVIKKYTQRYE